MTHRQPHGFTWLGGLVLYAISFVRCSHSAVLQLMRTPCTNLFKWGFVLFLMSTVCVALFSALLHCIQDGRDNK